MDDWDELLEALSAGRVGSREELERMKREIASRTASARVPTDAELLARLNDPLSPSLRRLLRTKPSRSLSGVTVVAIMAPPAPCPHGRCAYCPGGVEMGTPQSYTGREPAALRAGRADYKPMAQVHDRLQQLAGAGHATDKVELVVMGGTFPAQPEETRWSFLREAIDALSGTRTEDLSAAIDANETGVHRCVALTLETRPDLCDQAGVDGLLAMGGTRVEVGVQVTEDRPLALVGRGHGVEESVHATQCLKDGGLKVGYHLMLGLPGMSPEDDLRALRRVMEDPQFRPDLLKLYPTLVMPGTPLHALWEEGGYEPLDETDAVRVLARFKAELPPWVRVSRVERDIPSNLIAAGVRSSNLRQLVAESMVMEGRRCRCIRCREVGRRGTRTLQEGKGGPGVPDPGMLEPRTIVYEASGGTEAFLSLELPDEDAIVAYARVRRPGPGLWREELQEAAVLREVRVLGEAMSLGRAPTGDPGSLEWQHRGLGGTLVESAERLAEEWGMRALAVTAGMGTRGYFRRRGYRLSGPYMLRPLR